MKTTKCELNAVAMADLVSFMEGDNGTIKVDAKTGIVRVEYPDGSRGIIKPSGYNSWDFCESRPADEHGE